MKSKIVYNVASKLCLILFYVLIVLALFALAEHYLYIQMPDSAIAQSLGGFKPLYGVMNIEFFQQPELYTDKSFLLLSLASTSTMFLFVFLFLWYMHKFLKNMSKDGLFMYENVSILFKLGLTNLIAGSAFLYVDGLLLSKAIAVLQVANAQLAVADLSFLDMFISGSVLMIMAAALKTAVQAIEENKNTI